MIYVTADIHGKLDKLLAMLEKIHFTDDDTLYIAGDMVDRGEKPIDVVSYVREHKNIIPIMGNHDEMAYTLLEWYDKTVHEGTPDFLALADDEIVFWSERNGGRTTIRQFKRLSSKERYDFIEYLKSLPLYMELDVGDTHFILVHAGLPDYTPGRDLSTYDTAELVWTRPDYDEYLGQENLRVIVGHTPTPLINGTQKPEIYRGKSYINIDCAACFEGGRLACLCLDTDEEYYV